MYNLLLTFAILIWFIDTSSSQDPDFQCDFGYNACNIIQDHGDQGYWWFRYQWNYYYQPFFGEHSSAKDKVKCSLPDFKSPSRAGIMMFRYWADANGHLEVSVCEDGSDVRSFNDTSDDWTNVQMDISCCSSSMLQISFTAVQDDEHNAPGIGVDDIKVYQIFPPSTTTSAPPTTPMSTTQMKTTQPTKRFVPTSTSSQPSTSTLTTSRPSTSTSRTSRPTTSTTTTSPPSTSTSTTSWSTTGTSKTTSSRPSSSTSNSSRSSTSNTKLSTMSTGTTRQTGSVDGQSDHNTVMIPATVGTVVLIIIAIAVFFIIAHHRKRASEEKASRQERRESRTDSTYANAAFSPEIPNPVQSPYPPDLVRDLGRTLSTMITNGNVSASSEISLGNSVYAKVVKPCVKPPIGNTKYSSAYAYPHQSKTHELPGIVGDEGAQKDQSYEPMRPQRKPKGDATKRNQNVRNGQEGRYANCELGDNDYCVLEPTTGSHYHPEQQSVDNPTTSEVGDYQHLDHYRSTPTVHPDIDVYGAVTAELQEEGTYSVLDHGALKDHSYHPLKPNKKPKGDATKGNQNVRNEQEGRYANCELSGNDYYVLEHTTGSQYHPEQQSVDKPTTSEVGDYQHLDHDRSTPPAHPDINVYDVVTAESQDEGIYNVLDHGEVSLDFNGAKKPQVKFRKGSQNEVDNEYNTLWLVDEGDRKFPPTPDNHDNGAYCVLDQNHVTVTSGSTNTYDVLHQTSKTTNDKSRRQTSHNQKDVDDYNVIHAGKGAGDYHQYQALSAKDHLEHSSQQGTPDVEYNNINHSGKEVGDYHQYQATDHPGDSDDVYYSAINEHNATGDGEDQHEPIYENYSQ